MTHIGLRTTANIANEELSKKLENWQDHYSEVSNVQGAKLEKINLRGAIANNVFLAKANLNNSLLDGCNFSGADLRGASLCGASLKNALFKDARLNKVNLSSAILDSVDLTGADFTELNISDASLINVRGLNSSSVLYSEGWISAQYDSNMLENLKLPSNHHQRYLDKDFSNYDFPSCRIKNFSFDGFNISGADLSKIYDFKKNQINGAIMDSNTILPN